MNDTTITDTKADVVELDDIERIERRMEARRTAIRDHLAEARGGLDRTARSWPIVAVGAVAAALALGYVVARRASPTRRFVDRARDAPDAARRYIHRATAPPSSVWKERAAAGAGMAMAFVKVLPQIRALVAGLQAGRRAAR